MPDLYFDPTWVQVREKYLLLSRTCSGCVLSAVFRKELTHVEHGGFELRGLYLPPRLETWSALRSVCYATFVLVTGLVLSARRGPFDAVVAHDAFKTGLLALVLSRLTGAKLIIDVQGNHARAIGLDTGRVGVVGRLKHWLVMRLTPFVLNRAHGIKLLYDDQLGAFDRLFHRERCVRFHDFAPLRLFAPDGEPRGDRVAPVGSKYILFVGSPWFLKGVDVLIQAFRAISEEFPEYTLKVYGYTPDRPHFERLAAGHPRIELHGPVPYETVIRLMAGCVLFVLPSRTEAMGRVLLEAMASRKPVVASRVDGVPTYVRDGYNGLLVEPGDPDGLARAMRRVLGDPTLAARLAENGYRHVHSDLSEARYLAQFTGLVEAALKR